MSLWVKKTFGVNEYRDLVHSHMFQVVLRIHDILVRILIRIH
jgi:hypothetical protein